MLRVDVAPQVDSSLEGRGARDAGERAQSGVLAAVRDEVRRLTKGLVTLTTHVRLLAWQRTRQQPQKPDLQNTLRQSCDYLTIMPQLRSTYDGRLIYQTSYILGLKISPTQGFS